MCLIYAQGFHECGQSANEITQLAVRWETRRYNAIAFGAEKEHLFEKVVGGARGARETDERTELYVASE